MSNLDITYISELKIGQVIPSDIYFDKTLLIKAGTKIDNALLQNLHNWGITKLSSLYTKNETPEVPKPQIKKKEKIFYSKELFDIKKLFYESLQYVVSETRYGLILNGDAQITWLENLFISSLLSSQVSIALLSLKKKDPYSYFHSFDVFLLGSLLAEMSGIRDIRSFAIGCLLHDIGKLQISNELLQKEGKLSKAEFDEIQKHPLYGVDFMEENNLSSSYKDLVKSHHERLDGTGYPEGLTESFLSEEVRLLAVVDTYSALTLQRSYRGAFSSIKAFELLLGKHHKYDKKFVINLMELVNIYPTDSIVRLSNGKKAKIKSVHENQPYFPFLEEIGTKRIYQLPLNFSVTISRFIEWDQVSDLEADDDLNKKEIYWSYFINHISAGNMEEAMNYYRLITEGMELSNIFIDVIIRMIKEIEIKRVEGELSTGEEHDAFLKIKDILVETFNK